MLSSRHFLPLDYRKPFYYALLLHGILLGIFLFHHTLPITKRVKNPAAHLMQAKLMVEPKKVVVPITHKKSAKAKKVHHAAVTHHRSPIVKKKAVKKVIPPIHTVHHQTSIKPKAKTKTGGHPLSKPTSIAIQHATPMAVKKTVPSIVASQTTSGKAPAEAKQRTHKAASSSSVLKMSTAEISRYTTLIQQAISQHWLIPAGADPTLTCRLEITLAPGGEVESVKVIRSSGEAALDRSAVTAVLQASPLPVPEGADFSLFQHIRLTVRPEHAALS